MEPCADTEGAGGPEKLQKSIGFLSKTGPDPIKATKLPSQHSMFGRHRPTSETPFTWHFAGGPIMAAFSGIMIISPLINPKTTRQSWTLFDKTFWIRAWERSACAPVQISITAYAVMEILSSCGSNGCRIFP